jgi:hypothetical protein
MVISMQQDNEQDCFKPLGLAAFGVLKNLIKREVERDKRNENRENECRHKQSAEQDCKKVDCDLLHVAP